jgi:hypothetical protein
VECFRKHQAEHAAANTRVPVPPKEDSETPTSAK